MDEATMVEAYFSARTALHEMFGYREDWACIPMEDHRGEHWILIGGEGHGGKCYHSKEPMAVALAAEEFFGGPIYTKRHLPKWVYRSERYVMVCVDTRQDMNRILMVFDADKECTDEALRDAYKARWG